LATKASIREAFGFTKTEEEDVMDVDEKRADRRRRGVGEGAIVKKSGRRRPYAALIDLPRDEHGARRRRVLGHYGTRAEAQRRLREELAKRDKGTAIAEPGRLCVRDLVDRYLAAQARTVEATTLENSRSALRRNVLPHLGSMPLSRIQPVHVVDWLNRLDADFAERAARAAARKRRSPERKRARQTAFEVLNRVLDYGVGIGLLGANPCDRIDRPKAPKPEIRSLSAEDVKRLLRVARETSPTWVTAATALGACGLRRGETFGLTWSDLDLENGRVRVRQSLKAPAKGKRSIGPPKSKAARREVGLPSWALSALRVYREDLPATPHPTRLVFTTATGEPVFFSNFNRRHFAPLVKRAEIPWATYHSLRHTFATLLLGSGCDLKSAQAALGHEKASYTIDLYASAIPQNVERAIAGLDAIISNAKGD
jgi:integrase